MTAPYNPYLGLSRAELYGRRKDYAKLLHAAVAARKAADRQLTLIVEAIQGMKEDRPCEVSDHAVVRYLERVRGMDLNALRDEISLTCEQGAPLIGDKMRGADGFLYCLNNDGFITTVLPLDAIIDEAAEQEAAMRERPHPNASARRRMRGKRDFIASAGEAQRAETVQQGSVHEHATGKAGDAQ